MQHRLGLWRPPCFYYLLNVALSPPLKRFAVCLQICRHNCFLMPYLSAAGTGCLGLSWIWGSTAWVERGRDWCRIIIRRAPFNCFNELWIASWIDALWDLATAAVLSTISTNLRIRLMRHHRCYRLWWLLSKARVKLLVMVGGRSVWVCVYVWVYV